MTSLLSEQGDASDACESVFEAEGESMRALVMHPGCLSKSTPSPLIVYLHGWNQSGNGKTVAELQHVKDRGSRLTVKPGCAHGAVGSAHGLST